MSHANAPLTPEGCRRLALLLRAPSALDRLPKSQMATSRANPLCISQLSMDGSVQPSAHCQSGEECRGVASELPRPKKPFR